MDMRRRPGPPANDNTDQPLSRAARIRELNDAFRRTFVGGYVIVTRRLAKLGRDSLGQILIKVVHYPGFDGDTDPDATHDRGTFDHAELRILWKIDYFEEKLAGPSPDPADDQRTCRVLTVMLADEEPCPSPSQMALD